MDNLFIERLFPLKKVAKKLHPALLAPSNGNILVVPSNDDIILFQAMTTFIPNTDNSYFSLVGARVADAG